MKKVIAIAILLVSSVGFSQIKVVETVPVERLGRVNNSFYVQKIGDEYTFFYTTQPSDTEEEALLKNFTFKNVDNAYQSFYSIISKGFSANPLNDIKLELPNNFLWLHYIVSSDKTTVQFMVTNKLSSTTNVSEPLSREQIEKLFQKS
ncbi:hypothetical protein [Flavobacterium adhaerens]|uniref:hypothetical protein n=1 Tax=Flavobacterium adhaerens TaxID=3149043 RepID=UPI0032B3ECB1